MCNVWLIGFFVVLVYRVYNAGKMDFTYGPGLRYQRADEINADKLIGYILISAVTAIAWPFALPAYGIFKLGQKRK